MKKMQKHVLIFGSNGFIGSALCRKFEAEGYLVDGCDLEPGGFGYHRFFPHHTLETTPGLIFSNPYDICINCAGSASVPYSFQDPFKDYELNTRIVFKILSELKNVGSKARFVNMSSAAVYGNPQKLPVTETNSLRPISPYGNHKLMSEMIVDQFSTYFGINGVSLRIFSAYGPGLKKQIFWDLYQKALQSDCIEMAGTGNESRDFIFIDDLVQAIYLVAVKPHRYTVYNIANGSEITIRTIAEEFCKAYDSRLRYTFTGDVRPGDPHNWRADVTRLKELGYQQQYSVQQGIQALAGWLKQLK